MVPNILNDYQKSGREKISFNFLLSTQHDKCLIVLSRMTLVVMELGQFQCQSRVQGSKRRESKTKVKDVFIHNLFLSTETSTGHSTSATKLPALSHNPQPLKSFQIDRTSRAANVTSFMCALPDARSLCLTYE
jgi:hypothetical protein